MKHALFLSLCLLFVFSFTAKANDCLPLKVRNPQGNYIVPGVRGDIVYSRVNGVELALDAYVQQRGKQRPAVIIIHGGGFTAGSRVAFTGQFMEMLTQAGFNWFAIDYRKHGASNYKESLDDVRAALQFIRCHAREFRIDPNRIALLGEDTGATLAALLAKEKPAGVKTKVLIGGVYDERLQTVAGMPDTLIVHGAADREAPPEQAQKYCDAISAMNGTCEHLAVPNASHRPENWWPDQWSYKTNVIAWLNQKLKLSAPDHQPYRTNLQKDIVFSARHNLKLDAYTPKGRGPFPAVIIAHGGGWEAGDKVTYATPLFEPLAKAGFAWFSIDYRLTPKFYHQDQLEDLRTAIRFVQANAKRFHVDPTRLAILGESASGQMVSYLASNGQFESIFGTSVKAVVSFYGVYDLTALVKENSPRALHVRLFGMRELTEQSWRLLRRYSPLYNVDLRNTTPEEFQAIPPMLLICGTKDGLFAQQTAFAEKLRSLRVRHETIAIPDAPHGVENWEGHAEWMSYKQKLVAWLKQELRVQ